MKNYYLNLVAAIWFAILIPLVIIQEDALFDPFIILAIIVNIANIICLIIFYRDDKRRRDSEVSNHNRQL